MTEQIRRIHAMSDCTYGRARVQAELSDMGLCVNHKRIERLMKLAKLHVVSRRRGYVVTAQRDHQAKAAPDLVKRQFTATGINQLWVADMTYVPSWVGFLYLAVVVDVYSRKVVGWAFGERMTSDLVIAALNMAWHGTAHAQAQLGHPSLRPMQPGRIQPVVATPSIMELFKGRPAGWMQKLTGRGSMCSPGAPSLRREFLCQLGVQTHKQAFLENQIRGKYGHLYLD
jgi:hypothetical protein